MLEQEKRPKPGKTVDANGEADSTEEVIADQLCRDLTRGLGSHNHELIKLTICAPVIDVGVIAPTVSVFTNEAGNLVDDLNAGDPVCFRDIALIVQSDEDLDAFVHRIINAVSALDRLSLSPGNRETIAKAVLTVDQLRPFVDIAYHVAQNIDCALDEALGQIDAFLIGLDDGGEEALIQKMT
ncbi:hypothetical protein N9X87_00410 [bacterium]|nr:hypothetical protein [bacterium]